MRRPTWKKRPQGSQAGISLIELMIAGVIMVVGFLGLIGLVTTAIANNTRNRLDTTASMMDLAVIETILSQAGNSGTLSLTDCAGNTWSISQAPGGAALTGTQIDFSEASPPTDYHMNWAVCNGGATVNATYDVRWHVDQIGAYAFLVTVGAKLKGSSNDLRFYALPVNMRTIAGK